MEKNLYFKSKNFRSNKALADYVVAELKNRNIVIGEPKDNDYMFVIPVHVDNSIVDIYLGKNDEETEIPLWQIWPEIRVSFLTKIFTKVDKSPEESMAKEIENIVSNISGVSDVEWDT